MRHLFELSGMFCSWSIIKKISIPIRHQNIQHDCIKHTWALVVFLLQFASHHGAAGTCGIHGAWQRVHVEWAQTVGTHGGGREGRTQSCVGKREKNVLAKLSLSTLNDSFQFNMNFMIFGMSLLIMIIIFSMIWDDPKNISSFFGRTTSDHLYKITWWVSQMYLDLWPRTYYFYVLTMFKFHIFNWTFEPNCILTFSNNRCRKREPRFVTSRGNAQNNSLKRYRLRPRLWHGGKSSSKHISKNTPRCLKATSYHRTTAKNQITVQTNQIESFKDIFSTKKIK